MSRFSGGWVGQYRYDAIYRIGNRRYELLGFWSYLLAIASRYKISIQHQGEAALFPAGTIVTSLTELARSNKKSDLMRIRRMLCSLKNLGLIDLSKSTRGQVISILDWEEKYVHLGEKEAEKGQKMSDQMITQKLTQCYPGELVQNGLTNQNDDVISIQKISIVPERYPLVTNSLPNRTLNGEREEEREEERVNLLAADPLASHSLKSQPGEKFGEVKQATGETNREHLPSKQREAERKLPSELNPSPRDCGAPPSPPAPAALLKVWNEYRGTLPEAKALTTSRKKFAASRLRECADLNYWATVVQVLASSPFCTGENDRQWRAGFDFLLKPNTHVKATEGAYSEYNSKPKLKPRTIEEIYR